MKKITTLKKLVIASLLMSSPVAPTFVMAHQNQDQGQTQENSKKPIDPNKPINPSKPIDPNKPIDISGDKKGDEPYNNNSFTGAYYGKAASKTTSIQVLATPFGVKATQDKITLKEGDELTIEGKVTPDIGYSFKSIEAKLNEWHLPLFSVVDAESDLKQTDSGFSFRFKAHSHGKEKITFNIVWAQGDSSKNQDDVCPIEITVK